MDALRINRNCWKVKISLNRLSEDVAKEFTSVMKRKPPKRRGKKGMAKAKKPKKRKVKGKKKKNKRKD